MTDDDLISVWIDRRDKLDGLRTVATAAAEEMREQRDRALEGLRVIVGDDRAGSWAAMYAKRTIGAVAALQEDCEPIERKLPASEAERRRLERRMDLAESRLAASIARLKKTRTT